MLNLRKEFKNPGSEWRAKPFWAWNDELEEDEIRRQIEIFKDMGFGGYFMHSRVGLKTPFLGEKWFDMIAAGIDEGKRADMEAWIYDEDRWPSGIAGGYVTMDHRYRMQRLHCLRTKGDCIPTGCLAAFRVKCENGELVSYEHVSDYNTLQKDDDIFAFCVRTGWAAGNSIGFYNGMSYLDTLSKKAVRRFLDVAFEPYKRFKDEFGKGIKGFFTDEPNRSVFLGTPEGNEWEREGNQYQIPWTLEFANEFKARKNYDLIDRLPEVFMNMQGESGSKVRWDTSEVTAQLFVEAYPEQLSKWCEDNNLILTGHYLGEDNLYMLMWGTGVVDRFYESMQAPGIDLISQSIDYIVPKQLQTAARQFNKKWSMCEMYASSGWGYTLQQYKSYGEWNTVFGVNLRCPHLSLYSISGQRKRDCPPNISFQQHWYKEYRAVEDHFARLGVAVSSGKPECSLLMIHPVDSVSGVILPGWSQRKKDTGIEQLSRYNDSYKQLSRQFMGLHIDFDISEEAMIEKHGRVVCDEKGATLIIGEMKYRVVVIPRVPSLRSGIISLFEEFKNAGGKVIFVGGKPKYVNWEESNSTTEFECIDDRLESVKSTFSPYTSVKVNENDGDAYEVFAMHRRDKQNDLLFLVNINLDKPCNADVCVESAGQVQLWDTLTCEKHEVPATFDGEKTNFNINIPKGGSCLFIIAKQPENLPAYEQDEPIEVLECEGDIFEIELDSPNVLLLDRPEFSINGEQKGQSHILNADIAVRNYMGFERRSNSMYQPWFKDSVLHDNEIVHGCEVTLQYTFKLEYIPMGELFLALEQPQYHTLFINNHELEKIDCGYFADPCIRKIKVDTSLLQLGENTITVICSFVEKTDLEAMYLLGDFGVSLNCFESTIIPPVKKLSVGDITKQGLPFYAGCIRYNVIFDKFAKGSKICIDNFKGIAVKLYEKDKEPVLLPWNPYEARVSGKEIQIELLCSMGNAMGISKHKEVSYPLEPQGLMAKPKLKLFLKR